MEADELVSILHASLLVAELQEQISKLPVGSEICRRMISLRDKSLSILEKQLQDGTTED